jgi:homoserine dehydrogenase
LDSKNREKVEIGLIGFGTIGSGVVKALFTKRGFLEKKTGLDLRIKKICDKDISTTRGNIKIDRQLLTTDASDILNDPQIQIVIELIGGIHPAKEYILKALNSGKHVVTANKALLAQEGKQILSLAERKRLSLGFEGSVCAGIPIIKALSQGLLANQINSIFGIINGTTNFILSQMSVEGWGLRQAISEAKKRGIAERDPSLDIEGTDSAHKLAILAFLSFGKFVNLKDIFVEGISRISSLDVRYAKELGYVIKLLAIAKKEGDQLELRVSPTLIPEGHPLASIGGTVNAVYLDGDMVGQQLFCGHGAGQMPTASAVISDLVDVAQNIRLGRGRVGHIPMLAGFSTIKRLRKIDQIQTRYYIRFMAQDKPGVLAKISGILGRRNISIASVSQKERHRAEVVPVIMLTHEAGERNLRQALDEIDRLSVVKPKSVAIRIETIQ